MSIIYDTVPLSRACGFSATGNTSGILTASCNECLLSPGFTPNQRKPPRPRRDKIPFTYWTQFALQLTGQPLLAECVDQLAQLRQISHPVPARSISHLHIRICRCQACKPHWDGSWRAASARPKPHPLLSPPTGSTFFFELLSEEWMERVCYLKYTADVIRAM